MNRFVVTTVGTSLLTNQARRVDPELLTQIQHQANDRDAKSSDWEQTINDLLDRAMEDPNVDGRSAEIATIAAIEARYGRLDKQDFHLLVASDTFQGRAVAERLCQFLRQRGQSVDVLTVRGLTTASERSFQNSMKEFLAELQQHLDRFVAQTGKGARVIFNVSGSFKSTIATMTAFGLLKQADVFFMFESGELLRIPSLPIVFDESQVTDEALMLLEMMHKGLLPKIERLREAGVPDVLYVSDETDTATLSAWGELVLQDLSRRIYVERILAWPRLNYESTFVKDWNRTEPDVRCRMQETLGRISAILEESGDPTRLKADPSLQAEELRSGIEHARISGSLRLTYTVEHTENGPRLNMRRFGHHDIIKNP